MIRKDWRWLDSDWASWPRDEVFGPMILVFGLSPCCLALAFSFWPAAVLLGLAYVALLAAPSFSITKKIPGKGNEYVTRSNSSLHYYRRVMKLPKEDRALFPAGLGRTLALELPSETRHELNASIEKTLNEIDERNRTRARFELEARQAGMDTSHITEALERAANHVKIETDVLRELG